MPTLPPAKLEVVITGFTTASLIVTLKALLEYPAALVALTVNVNVPAFVGVPEITPLELLSDKPVGSVPLTLDQVRGVVPLAAKFAL